jgi:hypothetical protein
MKSQKNIILSNVSSITNSISNANVHINRLKSLLQECVTMQTKINQIVNEYDDVSSRFGIDLHSVVSLSFNSDIIQRQVGNCEHCIELAEKMKKKNLHQKLKIKTSK